MNYGKKDEDADTGLVRVDRTQVFQEGQAPRAQPQIGAPYEAHMLMMPDNSATVQQLAHTAPKMSNSPDEDRPPPLHRREVPYKRSHHSLLRHLEALPEQRCQLATDGPPCHQGAGPLRRGHHHGDQHNYEGHWW